MFVLLLLSFVLSWKSVGLDLGTQFYKLASSSDGDSPIIFADPLTSSPRVPSSAAVHFQQPKSFPLTESDFDDIEVRFGTEALSLLRRNPALGYEFLPRAIARNRTDEFHTGEGVQEIELFLLSLHNAFRLVQPFAGVSVAIPSFFTRRQISMVVDAVKAFELPLVTLMSDIQAIATRYAIARMSSYVQAAKHVLFVDVGSTATKVYALRVSLQKTGGDEWVSANQTGGGWTEKVGGYHFSKAIGEAGSLSLRKAQKKLIKRGGIEYEELFEDHVEVLEDLIEEVMDQARRVAPIDEVELIGGASRFKFVVETIRDATNLTIRKNLNPTESIAIGTVETALIFQQRSKHLPVILTRLPPTSMNITCGNRTSVYCTKGYRCYDNVHFLNLQSPCTEFSIIADPETIPEGTTPHLVTYGLTTPITLTSPNDNYTMKFKFEKPDASISQVEVCVSDDECEEEQFEPIGDYGEESDRAFFFLSNYLDSRASHELRKFIGMVVQKLNEARTKHGGDNQKSQLTDEMITHLNEITEQTQRDDFAETSIPELFDMLKALRGMATAIGLEISPPSPP
jgi:molecular chaperone DnaK (HSP70)